MAKTKLLIEDTGREYKISKEDIHIYAEQLGININNEKHLMWIAEEGLSANVPKPWLILCDKNNRIFYYNPLTQAKSWSHPLDKEYASLVSEERTRSKSLNSASSDYGFESKPLDTTNDSGMSSGRFPKAPLQQLSSLADAPPLSSSGKNTPTPIPLGRKDGGLSAKKMEFGRIENRRATQLAPVRLNTLKMPAPSQKSNSGMSFMPKGETLSRNVRRVKEPEYNESHLGERHGYVPPDDSNESVISDDGSKYSYEESEDEEKNIHGLEPYDLLDTSQLSPMHSADESPDALEINSLVQLGTKLPLRLDNMKKKQLIENTKENSPSLNLRKVGQPSFLKPLTQTTKKTSSFKDSKVSKKKSFQKKQYQNESDIDFEDKISTMNEEQKLMLDQIQKEWMNMQDELEKQEKEKYEEMIRDGSKKLEEEEKKLRKDNSEKISKIKSELQKQIEEEENAAEKSLQAVKISNGGKIKEEKETAQKELDALSESLKTEIKKMEEKNSSELSLKKKELEEAAKVEMERIQLAHESNVKTIEETQLIEISRLQESHKDKVEQIQSIYEKEEIEAKNKKDSELPMLDELQEKYKNLEKLIAEETEKYQNLLIEKENILREIAAEKNNLGKMTSEMSETQTQMQELQDDVEKTENDLDLLRSEKSTLISELSILKENVNNEKSNLSNLQKKLKSPINVSNYSKEYAEVSVNTYVTSLDTFCKASQISVLGKEVSCQIENILSFSEASCQTSVLEISASKSCQVDIVPYADKKETIKSDDIEKLSDNALDITLEKALKGFGTKLDSRINVIEHQLKLLQDNLPKPSNNQPAFSSQESVRNEFIEITPVPNADNRNIPPVYSTDRSIPLGPFSNTIPVSSHNKCKCEQGDIASCNVMQDVKNSVYRLNDILSYNFVPSLRNDNLYQMNQPVMNYSSPFESFYTQFREMQEQHRLTELKHKCENEVMKLTKSVSSNSTDSNNIGNEKKFTKPSYHMLPPNLYSYSTSDDPLIQARSIVLREQARTWKQQHSSNHIYSQNIKSALESSQSSFVGLNANFNNMPSSQKQSFINFEVDPESDYNAWMVRLNTLQQRIRRHKML